MNLQKKLNQNLERFVCDQKKAQELYPEAEASDDCNKCQGYEVFCNGYRNRYVKVENDKTTKRYMERN